MKRGMILISILSIMIAKAGLCDVAVVRNTLHNWSFEDGFSSDGTHPDNWRFGFPGDVPVDSLGEWELDSAIYASGGTSLHLIPHCDTLQSYFVTQFCDAPTFDLEGKTVIFSVKVRMDSLTGAAVVVVAYNPDSPDSFMEIPVVGGLKLAPEYGDTGFVELADSFVATGPAAVIGVMLMVNGYSTGARFDDVQVIYDVSEAGPGPDTSVIPDPLGGAPREFYLGAVAEITANYSEAAFERLPAQIAEIGDITNIFAHIKWNGLTGMPMLYGHDQQLAWAAAAEDLGLERMLTFDFTHDNALTAGEINPMPDSTPVDSLAPEVRAAYIDELVALVDEIDPIIVSVGIETSLFYSVRPDQWDNYILLMQEVDSALSDTPDIHITAYFVLTQMVTVSGTFIPAMRAAWEETMPYCESIGFSFYASFPDTASYADSFFTVVEALDPGKPIIIPEFGCRSDTTLGFSEQIQYNFASKIIRDIASTDPPPVAIHWYQMFDTQYLGTPEWFRMGFSTCGLHDYSYTPKMTHAAFRQMKDNTSIGEVKPVYPSEFEVTAYPNPFNSTVVLHVRGVGAVSAKGRNGKGQVGYKIYDITGRLVADLPLFSERGSENPTPRTWNPGNSVGSGVYLVKAVIGELVSVKKVIYLR